MRITDAFIGEHAVLYPQLGAAERAAAVFEDVREARAIALVIESGLASHAALEEELLFVEMESRSVAEGPIAAMRSEHADIETSLARCRGSKDLAEATDLILHVVDVARPHFAKEEDVLFPMAEQALDEGTLLRLGALWAERRLGGSARSGAAFADG